MPKKTRRTQKRGQKRGQKRRRRTRHHRQRRRKTRKRRGAGWERRTFGPKKYINPHYRTYKTVTYPIRKPHKFLRQFPGQFTRIGEWRQTQREKKLKRHSAKKNK
jgi:hypothetical protein|tara:strand:+ start:185 stop:499 length:315 start_codon:yes stop_codon:yes gene_type:complete